MLLTTQVTRQPMQRCNSYCSSFCAVTCEGVVICRKRLSCIANQVCNQMCHQPARRKILHCSSAWQFMMAIRRLTETWNTCARRAWHGHNSKWDRVLGLLDKDAVIVCHGDDDQCGYRRGQKQTCRFSTSHACCLQLFQYSVQRQSVNCQARRTTHAEGQRCCEL